MAELGCNVTRLGADMCAASMPGRASVLTGVPASVHGIYNNLIWDGRRFRNVNSADLRVDTLASRAKQAGLDVASVGFGMIGLDSCDVYQAPWWAAEMLHQDDHDVAASNEIWRQEISAGDGNVRLAALRENGLPGLPRDSGDAGNDQLGFGYTCDETLIDWCGGLATSDNAPNLILTEIASPDYFLHEFGCLSDKANEAMNRADAQIGRLIARLEKNKALHRYNIAVMSDHGFSTIEESIHPDVILPEAKYFCGGGILHVHYDNQAQLDDCTNTLSAHGVTPLDNTYLPPEQRTEVGAFLAPAACDFYMDYQKTGSARSPSKYRATHGFGPGFAGDDRFCVFTGPGVPSGHIATATAGQVAPTLASLIGLPTDCYPEPALFQPVS